MMAGGRRDCNEVGALKSRAESADVIVVVAVFPGSGFTGFGLSFFAVLRLDFQALWKYATERPSNFIGGISLLNISKSLIKDI
jgi:hypothetical protein